MHSAVIYHFSVFYSHYSSKAEHNNVETQGHRPARFCSASSTRCTGSPYTQFKWLEISWPNKTAILTFSTSLLSPSPRVGISQP